MKRTIRRSISLLLVLVLLLAALPAALAAGETLQVENRTLHVDETTTAHVKGSDGNDVEAVFISSDPTVISVSGSTLTARKVGTADITATLNDEDKTPVAGSVTVTVASSVTGIQVAPTLSIDADTFTADSAKITATVSGAGAGDTLYAVSSDPAVAALSASSADASSGLATLTLIPKKTGRTTVTLSCGGQTASVAVTVTASADHTIRFGKSQLTVEKGRNITNSVTMATDTDTIAYSSNKTAVATVNSSTGSVTGVAAGTATISAVVTNAKGVEITAAAKSYSVEVADAYKIVLKTPSGAMTAGTATDISATVYQYDAENGYTAYKQNVTITWQAYRDGIAAFDGETKNKAVTTTTRTGSSTVTLYTYSTGTSKTSVSVPLTVSVVIGGTTYTAADASVEVSPAEAASFSVQEDEAFDEDDFSTAVDEATGRYAGKLAAISISDTTGGSVYDGSGRVSTGTKYYVSGSRSYLISNLSFKTSTSSSSSSPYFLYVGYDTDGNIIATGKVTVGSQSVDMEYAASFGGSVTFDETDFSKAFSKYARSNEKLDYVTFALRNAVVVMNNKTYNLNDSNNDTVFGWAYPTRTSSSRLSATDKCYYQASASQIDLDAVTYVTGTYTTKYTVYIPYTAVGTSGTRYEGYTAVTVSNDDTMTSVGASLKSTNAAEQILAAYPNAAYVMFTKPAASEGQLLYNFRSIVNANYETIRFSSDKFYLNSSSSKDLQLNSVYFLPAADCASQIKLSMTVYNSSDSKLGSAELTLRVSSKTASSVFSDVTARTCSWAADAVDFMNHYGLVKGTSASTFNWSGNMTRGDFVLILYRNAGSPSVYSVTNPFTDVKSTDYYYEAVLWAYKNNIVNGSSRTTFSPKGKITREQIASILWRLADKPASGTSLRSYTDYQNVSSYAYDAMSWAVGSGYVKGSGSKLNPGNNATRAEVAVMLYRFLTK